MASILKPPTCTTAQRTAHILESGELVFDTDAASFYTGDGSTYGGALVFPANNYTYVGYASDSSGSNFSTTPSSSLPYRSEIHSTTPINNLSAASFSSWQRYLGNYIYTAYASDASGSNFSTVASSALMYRAEIHSEVPILSLSASDFASATWVKYIGDWSNIYIAYASDTSGSNFSTTQSDALPYRAILNTYTVKTSLSASDFAGCTWEKYVGNYVYVAYASNSSGADFSITPSNSLPYRAEINTEFKKTTLTSSDFSGATWVKYLGSDGQGVNPQGVYSSAVTYAVNDLVRYGDAQWICTQATTNNPPPSASATESNTYWSLYVADGSDGTGMNFTGYYQASQNYAVNDGVRYGNAQWICTQATIGNAPPVSSSTGSNSYWSLWISDGKGFDIPAEIQEDNDISNPTVTDTITPYFRYNSLGDPEFVAKKTNGDIVTIGGYPIIPAICVYVDEDSGTCAAVPVDVDANGKSTVSPIGVKTNLVYTWETPTWQYTKIQVFACTEDSSAITMYLLTSASSDESSEESSEEEVTVDTSYVWTASNGYSIAYSTTNSRWELLDDESTVLDYGTGDNPVEISWTNGTAMAVVE